MRVPMTSEKRCGDGLYWDRAWSLVEGCTPIGAGCAHCWAAAATHMRACQRNQKIRWRYKGLTTDTGAFNGAIRMQISALHSHEGLRTPTVFAVWNDLFHEAVHTGFIKHAVGCMNEARRHRFIVLTKRPWRMVPFVRDLAAHPPNVIFGLSASTQGELAAMGEYIRRTALALPLMLSLEPLLEPVTLPREVAWLDWVVVGAETGPGRRPCDPEWMLAVVRQCGGAGIPVFVKAANDEAGGRGRLLTRFGDLPADLCVREFPHVLMTEVKR